MSKQLKYRVSQECQILFDWHTNRLMRQFSTVTKGYVLGDASRIIGDWLKAKGIAGTQIDMFELFVLDKKRGQMGYAQAVANGFKFVSPVVSLGGLGVATLQMVSDFQYWITMDRRFEFARGASKGVAIRLILRAAKMILEGEDLPLHSSAINDVNLTDSMIAGPDGFNEEC